MATKKPQTRAKVDSFVHIYLSNIPFHRLNKIKKDLTVNVTVGPPDKPRTKQDKFFFIRKDPRGEQYISLPRTYGIKYLKDNGIPYRRMVTNVPSIQHRLEFKKELRPHQVVAFEAGLEACRLLGGTTISAHCGFGKTITALRLAYELDGVLLVLVHTDDLVSQWVDAINDTVKGAHVLAKPTPDQLRRTKQLQPDNPVMRTVTHVVMTIQSFISKDLSDIDRAYIDFFKHVGVLISDEAHYLPATSFRKCMQILGYIPFRVALTATPERKDNRHKWMLATFGEIAYRSDPKEFHDGGTVEALFVPKTVRPILQSEADAIKRKYGLLDEKEEEEEEEEEEKEEPAPAPAPRGKITVKRRTTKHTGRAGYSYIRETENLVLNRQWNELIVERLAAVMEENPQRCTMVISFYKSHLYVLRDMMRERGISVYCLFGKERDATDEVLQPGTVVLASYSRGAVGMNFTKLNTLILASPQTSILQTIGRILRNPRDMLIIDVVSQFKNTFMTQFRERKKQYDFYGFYFASDKKRAGPRSAASAAEPKRPKIAFDFNESDY